MALYTLGRKVRMEILNQDGDVCELLFNHKRSQRACRLLLNELKAKDGLTRKEFSRFAFRLANGEVEAGFYFTRRSFYAQVRRVLLTIGLLGIQQRPVEVGEVDLSPERRQGVKRGGIVDKYVAVRQPIARRPPDGLNLVRLTWIICRKWNKEFFEDV